MDEALHLTFESVGVSERGVITMQRGNHFSDRIRKLKYPKVAQTDEEIANLQACVTRLWGRCRRNEAGILEVHFICRMPEAARLDPYSSEVMQVFARTCNHVESKPIFVSGEAGWRYGVCILTPEIRRVQALLLAPSPQCGCNPWLDAGSSRQIYESFREWLKRLD